MRDERLDSRRGIERDLGEAMLEQEVGQVGLNHVDATCSPRNGKLQAVCSLLQLARFLGQVRFQ